MQGHLDVLGPGVAQGVVQCLLGHAQHGLLLAGRQGLDAVTGEGHPSGVGAVEDLDLGAQGGDEAVLLQRGGAQLDDGGAQFVGGLGGERGDLVQLALGPRGVAVDQGGGGLGGQAQREQLLAHRVVQLVGEPGALLGDGQLAAALVQARVGEGDRGVLGEDAEQFLVVLCEAAAAFGFLAVLVGEEQRPEHLVAVADRQAQEVDQVGMGGGPATEAGVLADVAQAFGGGLLEHRGEDAVLARQRADGLPLLVADAVDHELGEAAVVVGDAEGGVLRVEQLAGGGDDRLEDVAHLQVPAHGQQRGTHRGEAGPWAVTHVLTVPAGGAGGIGPVTGVA
ncbi:hypothetical protein SVIOM342S_05044 [Streptomyces violaceorubidus]